MGHFEYAKRSFFGSRSERRFSSAKFTFYKSTAWNIILLIRLLLFIQFINLWKIQNEDGVTITDDLEVAESFKEYFIDKIETLKNIHSFIHSFIHSQAITSKYNKNKYF